MGSILTNFFIYARKSTDDADRQIRSIEDQLAEVRELAVKHGLNVVDVLLEKQSAKKPGRPIFNQMIERIEKGEASGILAWHPDRLARNMLDGGKIIHLVDTGIIVDLKFPTIAFEPTSQGKLTLAMLFGMSKYYVDALSENIRRGQRQKLKNGIWPTVAPIGYLNDKKARNIFPDPERSPLIRKTFQLYATGLYTLDHLEDAMTGLGMTARTGEPLSRAQYHRLLQNPIYYGTIFYSGEHYEGKHEPIITKDIFDQCQAVIARKSQPKVLNRFKAYLYRGLFRCGECGCFVTTETQKGHNYLRCTKRVKKDCSQPYVREEAIAEQITNVLTSACVPDEWVPWMLAELENDRQNDIASMTEATEKLQKEIQATDTKLDRLMTGYLDQLFSEKEYRARKTRILADKQDITERLKTFNQTHETRFEPVIRFVNRLKQAKIAASSTDAVEKREFLKTVGSNLELVNRTLRFEPRNAWQLVVDSGRLAQRTTAPAIAGAVFVGETDHNHFVAERVRFLTARWIFSVA
ncbi:MAG TPA: recombinase family protein [Tepidisphaeraceae bacterium]|jgi:DNA invertase Pin-like site-specific DNA recombinase|nr:recombinase family protein [Tepidisphaeraceae bacterium]